MTPSPPILSLIIFLPIVTATILPLIPSHQIIRRLSEGVSFIITVAAIYLWITFERTNTHMQFVENYDWLPELGLRYIVGIDGISLSFILITTILINLVLFSFSTNNTLPYGGKYSLILLLEGGILGSLSSLDMMCFYIFWEATLLPLFFQIGTWGGRDRIKATLKLSIYAMLGSFLMLIAIIYLYVTFQQTFSDTSTNITELYQLSSMIPLSTQLWLFGAFTLAFAIKISLWPFHSWLPLAHAEAPVAASILLTGILVQLGGYGFMRFAIPLFPEAARVYAPMMQILGIIGIIYSALLVWQQTDIKKFVAYLSISHLGFVVIALFSFDKDGLLSEQALSGALFQMVAHGLSTSALFFLIEMIERRCQSTEIKNFNGLAKTMPYFSTYFIVATMASIALPGTCGFVGEFLILFGIFDSNPGLAVLTGIGVILGAMCTLKLTRMIICGIRNNPQDLIKKDLKITEHLVMIPLFFLIIGLGFFPSMILSRTNMTINHLVKSLNQTVETREFPSK